VIIVYILANVALIRFFRSDPERSLWKHVVAPAVGVVALAYPLYYVAKPGQAGHYNLVPYLVLIWIVLGFVAYFVLRARSPEKLQAMGKVLAEEEDDLGEAHLTSAPV